MLDAIKTSLKATCVFLLLALCVMTHVYAGDESSKNESGLSAHEPSYFAYADDDEDHLEFKVSLKYPLFRNLTGRIRSSAGATYHFYFSYTGKYDFFVFSEDEQGRESSPVISRLQNPGVFLRRKHSLGEHESGVESASVGWFHESNGQQISDQAAFNNKPNGQDFVSRGWDYFNIEGTYRLAKLPVRWLGQEMAFTPNIRLYCDCQGFGLINQKEDDIRLTFGGTRATRISDYDGLRLTIDGIATSDGDWRYSAQLRTGSSDSDALKRLTLGLDITYEGLGIPLTFFYFDGYGKDISTYHLKDSYLGIGLKFK